MYDAIVVGAAAPDFATFYTPGEKGYTDYLAAPLAAEASAGAPVLG
jgi:hypothetical protein